LLLLLPLVLLRAARDYDFHFNNYYYY